MPFICLKIKPSVAPSVAITLTLLPHGWCSTVSRGERTPEGCERHNESGMGRLVGLDGGCDRYEVASDCARILKSVREVFTFETWDLCGVFGGVNAHRRASGVHVNDHPWILCCGRESAVVSWLAPASFSRNEQHALTRLALTYKTCEHQSMLPWHLLAKCKC